MTADKKPREFWIIEGKDGLGNWSTASDTFDDNLGSDVKQTHVIEKSAYGQLEKQLDEALERVAEESKKYRSVKSFLDEDRRDDWKRIQDAERKCEALEKELADARAEIKNKK